MAKEDPRNWMWSEALQMLARAERLHRDVFSPPQASRRGVNWEPPTDVLETQDAVLVLVALPGVDPDKVEIVIHNSGLSIAGERVLPQGRFERHIPLPPGRYEAPRSGVANGCLVIRLAKAARPRSEP